LALREAQAGCAPHFDDQHALDALILALQGGRQAGAEPLGIHRRKARGIKPGKFERRGKRGRPQLREVLGNRVGAPASRASSTSFTRSEPSILCGPTIGTSIVSSGTKWVSDQLDDSVRPMPKRRWLHPRRPRSRRRG
jgi:hypothetical protein